MAYYGIFHSIIQYGIVLWGGSHHAIKIFRLQKKALRIIAHIGYRDHCREWFKNLKIMSVPSLFVYRTLLFARSILGTSPSHADCHSHNTRNKDSVYLPRCRLTISQTAPDYVALKMFNALPRAVRELQGNVFKNYIKRKLLENPLYDKQEFYQLPM